MNEVLQEVLKRADVIGAWLGGKIDKTDDFATEQAVDLAMQYVAFGRVYNTSILVLSTIAVIALVYSSIRFVNRTEGSSLLLFFPAILPFITACVHLKDTLLVWTSPKIWLIIQLTELTKGVSK